MVRRTEGGQHIYERLTMTDEDREPGDPIRKPKYDPCCLEHIPGRVCILEVDHG